MDSLVVKKTFEIIEPRELKIMNLTQKSFYSEHFLFSPQSNFPEETEFKTRYERSRFELMSLKTSRRVR